MLDWHWKELVTFLRVDTALDFRKQKIEWIMRSMKEGDGGIFWNGILQRDCYSATSRVYVVFCGEDMGITKKA